MDDKPYIPIACGDYDIYEIAIMQNRLLTLRIHESLNSDSIINVKPLALEIEKGAEYLKYSQPGNTGESPANVEKIRLDKIQKAEIIKA